MSRLKIDIGDKVSIDLLDYDVLNVVGRMVYVRECWPEWADRDKELTLIEKWVDIKDIDHMAYEDE